MKRFLMCILLIVFAIIGGARFVDFVKFTDIATGFVTVGSVWLRYGILAAGVILCFIPLFFNKTSFNSANLAHIGTPACVIIGGAVSMYGFFTILTMVFVKLEYLKLIQGILYVLLGAWCIYSSVYASKTNSSSPKGAIIAFLGGAAIYITALERFLKQPSSLYRLWPVLDILSVIASLLFFTTIFKVVYTKYEYTPKRLCSFGLLSFFISTCLQAPCAVYLFLNKALSLNNLLLCIIFGIFGIVGAISALEVVEAK